MTDVASVGWVQLQGETLKEIALAQNGGLGRRGIVVKRFPEEEGQNITHLL